MNVKLGIEEATVLCQEKNEKYGRSKRGTFEEDRIMDRARSGGSKLCVFVPGCPGW